MTQERWERIQELYHAARALPASDSAQFLANACAAEPSLQRDVQALLDQPVPTGSFVDFVGGPAATYFSEIVPDDLTGGGLPRFVDAEFRAFLRCGFLAGGFARFRCRDCTAERLVAFSCKGRGFCPSCGGRRMAERSAHLVDRVLPDVAVRQWVLTLPHRCRYLLAWRHDLCRAVARILHQTIERHLRTWARRHGVPDVHGGGIAVIQRFGGSVNLNVHVHALVLDGVFARTMSGHLRFHAAPVPRRRTGPRSWRRSRHGSNGSWLVMASMTMEPPIPWRRPRHSSPAGQRPRSRDSRWKARPVADLMRRVFAADVLACSRCGGRLRLVATLEASAITRRILRHLGLPTEVPPPAPPRTPPTVDDWAA